MKWRIAISVCIGVASGWICWFVMKRFHQGAGDFHWALHLGGALLGGKNPYDTPLEQYPIPAGILAMPFLRLSAEAAAAVFYGASSTLLAFGLTRRGYRGLLIFLAYPYWAGMLAAQWSVLIMASAFFPLLLPVTLAKPQIGLPVFLTRLSWRGLGACLALGILSLIILPRWPWFWMAQTSHYEHFIPLLVLPGPLLLLALWRWRQRDAVFLFLTACMPQRWFFDGLILWLIPKSRREILFTVLLSWGAGLWRWQHTPESFTQVGRWALLFIYLPMLAVVLARGAGDSNATEMGEGAFPQGETALGNAER